MPRKHLIVSGRVQGVGFRHHASILAEACRLTGWVCNLDSGEVALEIQGHEDSIDNFLSRLGRGSMFIRIDDINIKDCKEIHESRFEVRH